MDVDDAALVALGDLDHLEVAGEHDEVDTVCGGEDGLNSCGIVPRFTSVSIPRVPAGEFLARTRSGCDHERDLSGQVARGDFVKEIEERAPPEISTASRAGVGMVDLLCRTCSGNCLDGGCYSVITSMVEACQLQDFHEFLAEVNMAILPPPALQFLFRVTSMPSPTRPGA